MDFVLVFLCIGIYIAISGNNTPKSDNESKTKLKDGNNTAFLDKDKKNSNESLINSKNINSNVKNVNKIENVIIPDEVNDTSNELLENKKYMKKTRIMNKPRFMVEKANNPIRNNDKLERVADYDDFQSSIRKNYKIKEYKENKMFLKKLKRKKLLGNQDNDDGPIKKL